MEQFKYAAFIDMAETVNPAIVELARAVSGSAALLKELNGFLLKKLKSEHASVRLAAVRCEKALASRLGMEWVEMLPEMLPFISELQDDDDEVVERETHLWILVVEEVMGESLDSMLQ
jgi:U3 small nucleolar RNA-associated protein 10